MRKNVWVVLALSGLVVPLGGCQSKAEKVTEDMLDVMKEYTELLQTIQSRKDFKADKDKLEALRARLQKIEDRAKTIEKDLSEDEKEQLQEKYKKRVDAAKKVIAAETIRVMRLSKPLDASG